VIGTDKLREVSVIKDNQVVYTTKPKGQTVEFTFTDAEAEPQPDLRHAVRRKRAPIGNGSGCIGAPRQHRAAMPTRQRAPQATPSAR